MLHFENDARFVNKSYTDLQNVGIVSGEYEARDKNIIICKVMQLIRRTSLNVTECFGLVTGEVKPNPGQLAAKNPLPSSCGDDCVNKQSSGNTASSRLLLTMSRNYLFCNRAGMHYLGVAV